jgi:hypothetical protein
MWHYARGRTSRCSCGRFGAGARSRHGAAVDEDLIIILNTAPALLTLAAEVLVGHIAGAGGAHRSGDRALPHGGASGGRLHVPRATALVSPRTQQVRRGAARGGSCRRGGARLPRGPAARPGDRLVAVPAWSARCVPGAACARPTSWRGDSRRRGSQARRRADVTFGRAVGAARPSGRRTKRVGVWPPRATRKC